MAMFRTAFLRASSFSLLCVRRAVLVWPKVPPRQLLVAPEILKSKSFHLSLKLKETTLEVFKPVVALLRDRRTESRCIQIWPSESVLCQGARRKPAPHDADCPRSIMEAEPTRGPEYCCALPPR